VDFTTNGFMYFYLRKVYRYIKFLYRRRIVFPAQRLYTKNECHTFICNICGNKTTAFFKDVKQKEVPTCKYCGSTLRFRSIVNAVSLAVFGKSLALPNFPVSKNVVCIGMSDADSYAIPLSGKLDYTNTYYHKVPKLDIANIEPSKGCCYDLIISTDVFEHVPPPIQDAFDNLFSLLKDDGTCVFSVPYTISGVTDEHFKDLFEYSINYDGKYCLQNTTRDGIKQTFTDLRFHGGPGSTLEMRVFALDSLLENLRKAGFSEIIFYGDYPDFGIIWGSKESLVISMRKRKVT
jgi:SAM-dependent methyltransferase